MTRFEKYIERWYHGMPPIEAVLAHETPHNSRSSPYLKTLTLGRTLRKADYLTPETSTDQTEIVEVEGDDSVYGEWMVQHKGGRLGDYVGVNRLKVVNGEIIYAIGFTQWGRLSDTVWAQPSSYFPVGHDGLPVSYTTTARKAVLDELANVEMDEGTYDRTEDK